MNKEVQKLLRRRTEKVEAFLTSLDIVAPAFQSSIPADTTNLCRNNKFCTLIKSEMYRYLKSVLKGPRFKDVRIRHTLEEVAMPDFSIDELTDKGKLSVYSLLMHRAAELDLFSDDNFKSSIRSDFIFDYVSKVVDNVLPISWGVIIGSMIVDTMPDVEGKWLDIGNSISNMVEDKYEDTTIIISNVDKVTSLVEATDDYIDYVTMMLGINLFKFCRKLDEESRSQIFGNVGDLVEFREVASTVFLMELLCIDNVDEWILRYLVKNIDILM